MRLNGHMLPKIKLHRIKKAIRSRKAKENVIEDWFGLQKRLLYRVQIKAINRFFSIWRITQNIWLKDRWDDESQNWFVLPKLVCCESSFDISPNGFPKHPSLHWSRRNEPDSCCELLWWENGPKPSQSGYDFFNLEPVRGIAKRWQVVMDSPMARGAEPWDCNKKLDVCEQESKKIGHCINPVDFGQTLTLSLLFSSAAEAKTTSTNTMVMRNSTPKAWTAKMVIMHRNLCWTWPEVRAGLTVVVPSPSRPRTLDLIIMKSFASSFPWFDNQFPCRVCLTIKSKEKKHLRAIWKHLDQLFNRCYALNICAKSSRRVFFLSWIQFFLK